MEIGELRRVEGKSISEGNNVMLQDEIFTVSAIENNRVLVKRHLDQTVLSFSKSFIEFTSSEVF